MNPFLRIFLLALCLLPGYLQAQMYQNSSVYLRGGLNPDWKPFYHGVASGDPLTDQVIIWTRVTPEDMSDDSISVDWRIATDPELKDVVQSGTFVTFPERDFTVKVDVTGLQAGTTYYYGFTALGANSLTGRTRTVPAGTTADHLKFAVISCSNFQHGFFNNYQRIAERNDLDAVIHLGDYIYEYADGIYGDSALLSQRPLEPSTEIVTLEEYRARYSTYRLDSSLVRAHQQHPFITVWDDHESANDAYVDGAENHDPATQGNWEERKAVSKKVYFEWMPIREQADDRVYRTIQYGDLAEVILLDTRLEGREEQIFDITNPAVQDTNRTLLGEAQYDWFIDQLTQSTAQWKIVAQQVMFADFNVGWAALLDTTTSFEESESLFLDIWDGYPAERLKIINTIQQNDIDDVVILTGDLHCSFGYDVSPLPVDLNFQTIPGVGTLPFYAPSPVYDPATGDGSVAVEFLCPSITSANFDENIDLLTAIGLQAQINNDIVNGPLNLGNPNPHMKYVDLIRHGYFILDVKPDSTQANWYYSDIQTVNNSEAFDAAWYTKTGENHLEEAGDASAPKAVQDVPAPPQPPLTTNVADIENTEDRNLVILGIYPNPFQVTNTLHYTLRRAANLQIDLIDFQGRRVKQLHQGRMPAGVYSLVTSAEGLPAGTYFYSVTVDGQVTTHQVVVK